MVRSTTVVVEPVADGFRVSCPVAGVVGLSRTESTAWSAFLSALRAQWQPPTRPDDGNGPSATDLPALPGLVEPFKLRTRRMKTIRRRDLLG